MNKIFLLIIAVIILIGIFNFIINNVLKPNNTKKRKNHNTKKRKNLSLKNTTTKQHKNITPYKKNTNQSTKKTQSTTKPFNPNKHPTENQSDLNQRELTDYIFKNHSIQEIGKIYERYIGYLLENKNFTVEYHGIKYGVKDQGIDLIATSDTEVLLVQVKNWSKNKVIYENHLNQLYGAASKYIKNHPNPNKKHYAVFMTSTTLSEDAKNTAQILKIKYYENIKLDKNYPMIKCKINRRTGNRIYHLPTDQHYDRATINRNRGEKYVRTVAEAEALGFRRAYPWKKEK